MYLLYSRTFYGQPFTINRGALRWYLSSLDLYLHIRMFVCWWRAACSVPGHHPSLWWYTVNWIPDWILMILSKWQQSSCENALKYCLSCDIRVYECDHRNSHLHRNIVVWTVCFFNLDATLGRWGRHGDCQVDDGVSVVGNSTAIGTAPGALTVAAGAYLFKLIIYRVITTCLALYIYLKCHCVIHYVFKYPHVKWTIFVSVIICWLLLHPL